MEEITKSVLLQYNALKEEIRDIRDRIRRDEERIREIEEAGLVSDTVTGTRKDGTFGPIKITGYPIPEHEEMKGMMKKRISKLHILEEELQEAVEAVDECIRAIPQSELRMMFRMYYLDDMTWMQVARNMNRRFPKKRIKFTEDSCRKRHDRYLQKK